MPLHPIAKRLTVVGALSVGLLTALLVAAAAGRRPAKAPRPAESAMGSLRVACMQSMASNTCAVMRSSPAGAPPVSTPEPVFIAGAGRVDAPTYRKLLGAGPNMCADAARACEHEWEGPTCGIARKLFLPPT